MSGKVKGLKVKTQVKAGAGGNCEPWDCGMNHNETMVSANAKAKGLKVKTQVKAGAGGNCEPWDCGLN